MAVRVNLLNCPHTPIFYTTEVKNNNCLFGRPFQSKEEWCFPFWNIFFRFRDIQVFVLCK